MGRHHEIWGINYFKILKDFACSHRNKSYVVMDWIENISFKQVLDNSKQAFAIVGCDLKFNWCNKSFLNLFGYTLEEIIEKTIFDVSDKENHTITKEVTNGLINGTIKDFEIIKKYVKKNGEIFYGKICATFISLEKCGQSLFFVSIEEHNGYDKKCAMLQSLVEIKESLCKKKGD